MQIVSIFVEELHGLHSIHYDCESDCEYERLFEQWFDREYLLNFCKQNQNDIFTDFWSISRLEDFVELIIEEAYALEEIMLDFYKNGFGINSCALQTIFVPLRNYEFTLPVLQESKAKVTDSKYFKKPKLRLYALRIGKNTFILTGGCIKLVHQMKESIHTLLELKK